MKQLLKQIAPLLLIVSMSGCLANPPDTTTGKTQAASLIFTDFEKIVQQTLSDRTLLNSIIEETYDRQAVEKHDYYWLEINDAIKIYKESTDDNTESWYLIHQRNDDTIRFQQTNTQAWQATFDGAHIDDSQYWGEIELLTDTLEWEYGERAHNQALLAQGKAINRDKSNPHYDVHYTYQTIATLHAIKKEDNYELPLGEIDFSITFPNRYEPTDQFRVELYIDGVSPSRRYIWK